MCIYIQGGDCCCSCIQGIDLDCCICWFVGLLVCVRCMWVIISVIDQFCAAADAEVNVTWGEVIV